jgi:hypothetical protein
MGGSETKGAIVKGTGTKSGGREGSPLSLYLTV